ncbi:MAG: sigma-54 dependent transcriptional regulator [Desulfobacterales bacterium]
MQKTNQQKCEKPGRLMIVDDDPVTLKNLRRLLERDGHAVSSFSNPLRALQRLEDTAYDVIISDIRMPDLDGLSFMNEARRLLPEIDIILITGFASIEDAVSATKKGAYHYLAKPFNPNRIRELVFKVLEERQLRQSDSIQKEPWNSTDSEPVMIGKSAKMDRIKQTILQIGPVECNVLISGESGTGKELVARSIHFHSPRAAGPFMAFNCGAFSEDLITNELFGHEKEAYTGASSMKKGLLEAAHGGTVFLDEISDMSLSMQSKLLRVIQERELIRVGGTRPVPLDIRFIAATAKDLQQSVKEGTFRGDLYFRLNVVNLLLPPLSERREDIPLLAFYLLGKFVKKTGKRVNAISDEAIDLLKYYAFPGNIRELENILERAVAMCRGDTIQVHDLPSDLVELDLSAYARPAGPMLSLEEVEKDYIGHVLKISRGSRARTAEILGIDRTSLWRKMKKYDLL